MKRLQEDTMCKMAVLGRGSVRDRKKEEEMRASGDPRYSHLFEDLHVEISTFAAPAEAHARIAYALAEVRRFLVPVSIFFIPIIQTHYVIVIYHMIRKLNLLIPPQLFDIGTSQQ